MRSHRRRGVLGVVGGAVAGMLLAAAIVAPANAAASGVRIALTFDDLPAHAVLPPGESWVEVTGKLLAALHDADAPAFGFVNGVLEEREPTSVGVLSLWRAAGQPLGNHAWSHPNLNTTDLETWEADLVRNEPLLERHMAGQDWRWVRFPFLSEGETPEKHVAARQFLKGRGYRIASVTMTFDDWAWNEPYARCVAKGDAAAIADMEDRFLKGAADSLAYSRSLSATLYGRDIPYVLLMHAGAFDARMLPRLLAFYREQGVTFVSLQEAEKDRFYAADAKTLPTTVPTTLENAMKARGLPLPPHAWAPLGLEKVCR